MDLQDCIMNHNDVGTVGLWRSLIPPLSKAEQITQDLVQLDFEYLQAGNSTAPLDTYCSVYPHCKLIFPTEMKFLT